MFSSSLKEQMLHAVMMPAVWNFIWSPCSKILPPPTHHLPPMINLDVGLVTMPQPGFSVLPSMIGTPLSKFKCNTLFVTNGLCRHHDKIRDLHPDFVVMANSWPTFLYEDYKYDLTDPAKGLFKGSILLKVHDSNLVGPRSRFGQSFKLVFTSPTSVDEEGDAPVKHQHAERCTHFHVAQILKMKKVTPWAIAYIAVQVRLICGVWILNTHFVGAFCTYKLWVLEAARYAVRLQCVLQHYHQVV